MSESTKHMLESAEVSRIMYEQNISRHEAERVERASRLLREQIIQRLAESRATR